MKKNSLLLLLSACFFITACKSEQKEEASSAALTSDLPNIVSLAFALPPELQWRKQSNNDLATYTVLNVPVENSPLKITTNVINQVVKTQDLVDQLVYPIASNCTKSQVNVIKSLSTYPKQLNFEIVCAQQGNTDYGRVTYVSAFSDSNKSHIVIAESVTPKTVEPGQLQTHSGSEEESIVIQSIQRTQLMQNMMKNIKACTEKECI